MTKYIIIGIIAFIVLMILIIFNSLVKANNRVKEAFATMDVYLKKRWDLIPNIVEIVKGYAKHEKDTLKEVVELRNSINEYDKLSMDEKINTSYDVNKGISKLMMLAEAYPDLKADKNYLDLSKQLIKAEEDIANSRKYFNAVVREYNNLVEMFPQSIVARIAGYKIKNMFEAKNDERDNVKINL